MSKTVSANAAAETLLGRRAYSARGLLDKLLEKGYSESESVKAVQRLMELGYLDDGEYARSLAASLTRRGYGARRVKQTLRAKGVDEETAAETAEIDEDEEDQRIDRWLEKLTKGRLDDGGMLDAKEKSRLFAALLRRGFGSDAIRRGFRRFQDGDDDWGEDSL